MTDLTQFDSRIMFLRKGRKNPLPVLLIGSASPGYGAFDSLPKRQDDCGVEIELPSLPPLSSTVPSTPFQVSSFDIGNETNSVASLVSQASFDATDVVLRGPYPEPQMTWEELEYFCCQKATPMTLKVVFYCILLTVLIVAIVKSWPHLF